MRKGRWWGWAVWGVRALGGGGRNGPWHELWHHSWRGQCSEAPGQHKTSSLCQSSLSWPLLAFVRHQSRKPAEIRSRPEQPEWLNSYAILTLPAEPSRPAAR